MRREIARQERRWRLLSGRKGTGQLDRAAFYLDILQHLFSLDELQDICFDLAIDYEKLPGNSKTGKARELMLYCQRHDLVNELYGKIRLARPRLFDV